ncbi:cytochrome B [Chitinophaga sp. Cy-1792]|uniref:cytochrome B n=1 Tax=Chitinophaga sp. Cy-1792 TaxID=2608339 RepID=UPI00141E0973|nr:cytochrome B [Chitinophaga sp. Cy-1792]NIG57080.1 cytochrome B [Chitinophaga sp. Cy-1792]
MLLVHLHSIVRWAVIFTGIWAVIRAYKGVSGKTPFTAADNKAGLFFMISCDIQLLIGIILYFVSAKTQVAMSNMGAAMKDPVLRLFAVEHETMAVIAIALVHIGKSKVKKATDAAKKHKLALTFYTLAMLVILVLVAMVMTKGQGGWA